MSVHRELTQVLVDLRDMMSTVYNYGAGPTNVAAAINTALTNLGQMYGGYPNEPRIYVKLASEPTATLSDYSLQLVKE